MNLKQLVKGLLISGGLLVTVATSADAQATATAYISGNNCTLVSGSASPGIWGWVGTSSITASGGTVWCDVGRGPDPVGILGIRAFDRNSNENVSCEAWGINNSGDSVWYSGVVASSGNQSAAQWLPVPVGIPSSVVTFSIKCYIPGPFGGQTSHLSGFTTL